MTQENTALLEALDTRLWCLHHIGPDEVHPAPDFDTAWKWAEWGNKTFAQHADISRFVVAVWPHAPEAHAADLPKSVAEWTLPATSPTDSLTADAAAVREADFIAADPVMSADDCNEDGDPLWYAEVQDIGGWSVIATVWGASAEQATSRANAIVAALAGSEGGR
ncbi:hypothetical protein N6H05_14905 [Sphingobium sp. WTD-1]|uniref:hypothetical protein n=1 Tax=Sphingobium sp. WTD-1 TaxID=2979467 RepID=UPI0024DE6507|nr:hypothetical protein [Sphingobium sp. WTD-1]WIA54354.1 hypothetical protein N6H05_14905 [Sphingobium sp. WTD-1]